MKLSCLGCPEPESDILPVAVSAGTCYSNIELKPESRCFLETGAVQIFPGSASLLGSMFVSGLVRVHTCYIIGGLSPAARPCLCSFLSFFRCTLFVWKALSWTKTCFGEVHNKNISHQLLFRHHSGRPAGKSKKTSHFHPKPVD